MAMANRYAKPESWKAAMHQSVYRSELPAKAIAESLGISEPTLSRACSDSPDASHLSSRHLPNLARLTSDHAWLDYLEALAGRVAFRVPDADTCSTRIAAEAMRAFAALLDAKSKALDDDTVTSEELQDITLLGHEVMRKVQAMVTRASALAAREAA
jgi:hypothetical protein